MRNAGQEGAQHEFLRGLSVATVGGVVRLPGDEGITFQQLPGFEMYNGAPFGFVFESPTSVWIADAGPGAQGGPAVCTLLGGAPCPPAPPSDWNASSYPSGLWDKLSCTLQHWTSAGSLLTGPWSWSSSIIVAADAPCYSLAGRSEGAVFMLYTTTASSANASSTLFSINSATAAVTPLLVGSDRAILRGVTFPPRQRANYTCPDGSFGASCDLACAYDCCAPCTMVCPPGFTLITRCSFEANNVCVDASPSNTASPSITATATSTATSTPTASTTATSSPSCTPPSTVSPSRTPPRTASPSVSPRPTERPAAAVEANAGLGAGVGIGIGTTLALVGAAGMAAAWAGLLQVRTFASYAPLDRPGGASPRAPLSGVGAADAVRRLGALSAGYGSTTSSGGGRPYESI